jgi:hypothetical protein
MITLFPLGSGTVHAVSVIHFLSGDKRVVRGLAMRTSTEGTVHTFAAALGMMMAPSLAPSAHDGTRVRTCSGHAAIDSGD